MSESAIASHPISDDLPVSDDEPNASTGAAPSRAEGAVQTEGLWHRLGAVPSIVYWGIHAGCLFALYTGVSNLDLVLCLSLFWARLFGITGGYHRYFAHKAFKTSRAFQFLLALLGCAEELPPQELPPRAIQWERVSASVAGERRGLTEEVLQRAALAIPLVVVAKYPSIQIT